MVADNSAGGDPSAPRRLGSAADVQKAEDAYAQGLEQAYGKLPSFANIPRIDAGIDASIKKNIDSYAQQQYQQLLSADLETQAAPNFSGHNYTAYTATQLKQMVATNMDPSAAGESASAWNDIGNDYVTVAQGLGQAANGSEYGWQGTAGDAARDFINGVSKWAGAAGQGAQLAGNRLAVQSEAASTAKNSMPTSPTEPPTSADISSAMLQGGFNPAVGAAKLNAQFAQAAADHAEAVQAARVYDSSLATSGEKFPAFNAPPTFDVAPQGGSSAPAGGSRGPGVGAAGNATHANSAVRGGGSSASRAGAQGGGAASVTRPPAVSGLGAAAPGSGGGQAGVDPGATTGASGTTTTSTSSAGNPGAGDQGTGNPGASNLGGSNPGGNGWPGSGSGSGWGSDPSFSGSLVGDGGAALGGGAGRGLPDGVSRGGVGRGGFGNGGGSANGGGRGGIGAGAVGEEEMEGGVGRRTGAAGEPGGAGMMPRGSRKGEDSEHKRPNYLQNPDPNATFGSDEYVVPPVIGA